MSWNRGAISVRKHLYRVSIVHNSGRYIILNVHVDES